MGYYIQGPATGKAWHILDTIGGRIIPQPATFAPEAGQAIICVVNNGAFEAAGLVWRAAEFVAFTSPDDPRSKIWLSVPKEAAHKAAGYQERHDG
jgi:hypothetical protein